MAEPYRTELETMTEGLRYRIDNEVIIESRHFFSGAALYVNNQVCALYGPLGLGLKLPKETRERINNDYRFYPDGPIKGKYSAVSQSISGNEPALESLLIESIIFVSKLSN